MLLHQIKLGVSPVLRKLLNSLDARLDSRPCISLSDFNSNAVISLLNFIYKGEVVLERRSEVQREFLKLCQTLRWCELHLAATRCFKLYFKHVSG